MIHLIWQNQTAESACCCLNLKVKIDEKKKDEITTVVIERQLLLAHVFPPHLSDHRFNKLPNCLSHVIVMTCYFIY